MPMKDIDGQNTVTKSLLKANLYKQEFDLYEVTRVRFIILSLRRNKKINPVNQYLQDFLFPFSLKRKVFEYRKR